jgi:arginyl-tRNA synthetase
LYELTGVFSAFYNADHIQGEMAEVQNRRLMLCQKTLMILETGLKLLGLKTVKRM